MFYREKVSYPIEWGRLNTMQFVPSWNFQDKKTIVTIVIFQLK